MRITEGQLRRIIREEILREDALGPRGAKLRRISFEVKRRTDFIEVDALLQGRGRIGHISSSRQDDPCAGAWVIDVSQSKLDGLGPLLYDLMIDLVHPHPLMSDRVEVSDDARRVWDYYNERRPDVDSIQLDDLKNTLTPVDVDNCEQSSAQIWGEDELGDEDRWPRSPLSKAYKRRDGRTPTLDELQAIGIIKFI